MPQYVAKLATLQLNLTGLEPSELQGDMIVCPLLYEDGSALSLVTMCVAKRRWFYEKAMIGLSLVELDENTRAVQVYFSELLTAPTSNSDVPFLMRYGAMVKAMLVTHAKTSNMGALLNLRRSEAQKRPASQGQFPPY